MPFSMERRLLYKLVLYFEVVFPLGSNFEAHSLNSQLKHVETTKSLLGNVRRLVLGRSVIRMKLKR